MPSRPGSRRWRIPILVGAISCAFLGRSIAAEQALTLFSGTEFRTIYSADDTACETIRAAMTADVKRVLSPLSEKHLSSNKKDFHALLPTRDFYRAIERQGFHFPPKLDAREVDYDPLQEGLDYDYVVTLAGESATRVAIITALNPSSLQFPALIFLKSGIKQTKDLDPSFYNITFSGMDVDRNAGNLYIDNKEYNEPSDGFVLLEQWPNFGLIEKEIMNKSRLGNLLLPRISYINVLLNLFLYNSRNYAMLYSFPFSTILQNGGRILIYEPLPMGRRDICYLTTYTIEQDLPNE